MSRIPVLDLATMSWDEFVSASGKALEDIGFYALKGHGIPQVLIDSSYHVAAEFFKLTEERKRTYELTEIHRQRGYTPFGIEHAKDNPSPDLKEFWQTGRSLTEGHPSFAEFPKNVWPEIPAGFENSIDDLYTRLEKLSHRLLSAASEYLGKPSEWLPEMARDGNTILRVIHYPPLGDDVPDGAVRSAAHEDINFITLLVGSTASGLQVMDHDGSWIDVEPGHDHIIVDSGDMLQNLTNGLFKSTTHRVINPPAARSDRYSMPLFVHPRNEIDLTPRGEFFDRTSPNPRYESITAGEYLHQRLVEIGLTS